MKLLKISLFTLPVFLAIALVSCDTSEKGEDETESRDRGLLEVYIDEAYEDLMTEAAAIYVSTKPEVEVNIRYVRAREAMAKLFAKEARIALIGRDYLSDEDSLMKIRNAAPHKRIKILRDALVFYAHPDFPLDTLNAEEIYDVLTNKDKKLTDVYGELESEPKFVCCEVNSSQFANMRKLAARGLPIERDIKYFDDPDSAIVYVESDPGSIGIGYLSEVFYDFNSNRLKGISIGFYDDNGDYIRPKPVHIGYVIKGEYPYVTYLYSYLLTESQDLAYWFSIEMSRGPEVQEYYKNSGVAPEGRQFKLIIED